MTELELAERMAGRPPWPRRLELLLAHLTYVLASAHWKDVQFEDFDLFGPKREPEKLKAEEGAHVLGALAGVPGVRMLGKKRRQREQQQKPDGPKDVKHGDESR